MDSNNNSPCVIGSIMTKNRVADGVIVIPAPKEDCHFRTGASVQTYGLVSDPASHVVWGKKCEEKFKITSTEM